MTEASASIDTCRMRSYALPPLGQVTQHDTQNRDRGTLNSAFINVHDAK
jgi:hypothetical protein